MESIYKNIIKTAEIGYAYYEVLLDGSGIGYDYKCVEVNKSFENHTGLDSKELIEMKSNHIFSDIIENEINLLDYDENIKEYEKHSLSTNKWYKIKVYSPKKNFITIISTDITQTKTLIKKLKSNRKTFNHLIDTIPSRIFWKDKDFKYLGCNKNFAEYTKTSIEKMIGKDDYEMGWVKKEYADLYRRDDKRVVETGQSMIDFEDKIITFSGESKWVKTSKIPLYDSNNNIYGLLGVSDDITKQKDIENSLRHGKLRYEQLAQRSKSIAWEVDEDALFTYINTVGEEVFGYSSDDIIGKMYMYDCFDLEYDENYKELVLSKIKNKENIEDIEKKYKNKNNEDIWFLTNAFPIFDEEGKLLFYRGIDIDITYLKKIEEDIKYLSSRDGLTGLYNRRFFEEELERLDTIRNLPISIIVIDVDGLKLVNDVYGHYTGDFLLRKIAEILKQECRSDDIIGRIGGDEFVILLPKTSSKAAESITVRIHEEVKKQKIKAIDVSISYGFDTKEESVDDIKNVYKKADMKMYHHKIKKKNRIRRETVEMMLERLFKNDSNQKSHSNNVSELSGQIGRKLYLHEIDLKKLKILGRYHDIGKIVISEDILNKNDKLAYKELEEVMGHPEVGYTILSSSDKYINIARDVLYHHERYDGKGYPKRLKREEIPLNSRILALANAYDNMINNKLNKESISIDEAIDSIIAESGKRFDPKIVQAFLNIDLKNINLR